MLPNFKTECIATEIRTEWHWHKNKYIVQWNRRKNIEMHTHICTHTDIYMADCFLTKSVKVIQKKDSHGTGTMGYLYGSI